MDSKQYISSEILELYVYGTLSEKENIEVYNTLKKYPEIEDEINEVKKSLIHPSVNELQYNPESVFKRIQQKLNFSDKEAVIIPIPRKRINWTTYIGWVVSFILLIWFIFSV
ncbi:hypothetical protein [Aquimarina sp. RZ0]|uniref:hypothetical protein n=1 Tax=Aquimarina sp. RZ0 TaxID=2607730 RepID=UPI0011F2798B|nr:hypothetical protein [Aquimarina sp. RZ0]KAA1247032.1 hypothetical protein F0000_04930 [Aquimarina sp. RZ0]